MISVKMTTTKGQLQQMAVAVVTDLRNKAIRILKRAGELAVNEARTVSTGKNWTDRTGNLRSSIGYVICEDGRPITQSDFQQVLPTAESGPETGRNYALSIASGTKGLALVVVAGMNYAVYVADKGYNVLSSSQILAEKLIPELFAKQAKFDENR